MTGQSLTSWGNLGKQLGCLFRNLSKLFFFFFFFLALLQHSNEVALRQINKLHFASFPVCNLHRKCYFSRKFFTTAWQDFTLCFDRFLFIYFVKISLTFFNILAFSASDWLTLIFTHTQLHTINFFLLFLLLFLSVLINYLYILPGLLRVGGGGKLCDLIRNWIVSHYKSRKYI